MSYSELNGILALIIDNFLVFWTFRDVGDQRPMTPWRVLLIIGIVGLTSLSFLDVFVYFVNSPSHWIFMKQLLRVAVRLVTLFFLLKVWRDMDSPRTLYFSLIAFVIYTAYRTMVTPTGLGSIFVWIGNAAGDFKVGFWLKIVFELIIALVLSYWIRVSIFKKELTGRFIRRNIIASIILFVIIAMRTSLISISQNADVIKGFGISFIISFVPIVLLLILVLLERNVEINDELREEQLQRITNDYRAISIQRKQDTDENTRRMIHDYKNHLLTIENMSLKNGDEEVAGYVKELIRDHGLDSQNIDTGSEIVNGLLSVKMADSLAKDILFSVVLDARPLSYISDTDMTTIFGNVLDNAIEGCSTFEGQKYIDIKGFQAAGRMIVSISNSYHGDIVMREGLPMTTKKRSGIHGIGLKSIRRALSKYGGDIDIKPEEEKFTLNLILPVEN